ncbi:cysteine protease [Pseudoclavibacter endophyticus]|nr:cysteine protease [Pseudoclavibacter endophyticus]
MTLTLAQPATIVFSVAAHAHASLASEEISITSDGEPVPFTEVVDRAECRLHRVETAVKRLDVRYAAEVDGFAEPNRPDDLDRILYTRPSRYCESDALGPSASSLFGSKRGFELVDAVVDWVAGWLTYRVGSSLPTDGARETYLKRQGVCRDYAHLVIAMLRARDMPARLVSVYAAGLTPMDFHAVVEACVDGEWYVVDATRMAPRHLMQRIATGRDAADTAFMTSTLSGVRLNGMQVNAWTDDFALDDPEARVRLR